ncbi:MAG: hypothetical protein GXP36_10310 [Actinobacteria bacterium]|nr:hypothetical protein [Actinomycetota bacterium]
MVSERFERLFGRLVVAFKQHQDVPRTTANVVELGAARWVLEAARTEIAAERVRMAPHPLHRRNVRKVNVSENDLARLQVFGVGSGSC